MRYLTVAWFCLLLCAGFACAAAAPQNSVLPNGLRVVAQQDSDSQLVAIDVFVRTGGASEEVTDPGIGNFVAGTVLLGTSNQDRDTIQQQIEMLGGNVTSQWAPAISQIRVLTRASSFDDAAYLISDVLKNASFDPVVVEDERKDLLANIQEQSDDLFQAAYDNLRSVLYAGTPCARPALGDSNVIRRLSAIQLRRFFTRYYTPGNIVISVVGNVAAAHVAATFGTDLEDFSRPSNSSGAVLKIAPLSKPVVIKKYRPDLTAGYVLVGYLAPGAGSKDYPAMLLANALLGGMKTSLVFVNLREKKGLGYDAGSIYRDQIGTSDCVAYMVSAPTAEDPVTKKPVPIFGTVRDGLLDQFAHLQENPPTPAELAHAKRYLIGSYLIEHERLEDRAYYLGFSELALQPLGGWLFDEHYADAINAVSAQDVQRVARQYLGAGYGVSLLIPGDEDAGTIKE